MRKTQNFQWNELSLGVCYYPEHWDRTLWREDLQRMLDAGIRTIRIGEFAWSKIEPEEGRFEYDFFDDFLAVVEKTPMKVIFGTPSATPPAWLTEKYPEVLNCRKDGVLFRHGMRRHYNYNSPVYRRLVSRVVEKIAAHYAKHPSIIGWQIDNELNCEMEEFYSESDTLAFRTFLKDRYGSLDALNDAWGTVFWNQTYTAWEEIYVPRTTVHNTTNPHQTLDYIRFISDSAIRFCRMQSDILRRYVKPGDFITTNGMFGNLDNHRMTDEALDVYTYDSYPNFSFALDRDPNAPGRLNDRRCSGYLSEVRSICPHFGIMEQQSGANGWVSGAPSPSPKPGQMMLWAMQSIAHGADFVSFFRWRTAPFGTEINWHGILDWDNRDNRKLAEFKQIADRSAAMKEIAGADYLAAFAVLRDYDNLWDGQIDRWHGDLLWHSEEAIVAAAQYSHTPMDYLWLSEKTEVDELLAYPLLIYPHPMIVTPETRELLTTYVRQGGCLIIGARSGLKDTNGRCVMEPMPGLWRELTGTEIIEGSYIGPADEKVYLEMGDKRIEAGVYNEAIQKAAPEVDVLAEYSGGRYDKKAALTVRGLGKGRVLYYGSNFTEEFTKELFAYTGVCRPFADILKAPKECEIAVRQKGDIRWIFVLNYSDREARILLKEPLVDIDHEKTAKGQVSLLPYETKVYRMTN